MLDPTLVKALYYKLLTGERTGYSNPQNSEALRWLGLFYDKLANSLERQNRKAAAQIYWQLLEKVKIDYRERFHIDEVFDNDGGR